MILLEEVPRKYMAEPGDKLSESQEEMLCFSSAENIKILSFCLFFNFGVSALSLSPGMNIYFF